MGNINCWPFSACVMAITVGMLLLSCYDWVVVSNASNETYEVVAREQLTDVTTVPALLITSKNKRSLLGDERDIVKLAGFTRAALKLLPGDILFASTFHDSTDYQKLYFLVNLNSLPPRTFMLEPREEWVDGSLLWSDTSEQVDLKLHVLEGPSAAFHLSRDGFRRSFDVFILGAEVVDVPHAGLSEIGLHVKWRDGSRTMGLMLQIPEELSGLIGVEYEGEAGDL